MSFKKAFGSYCFLLVLLPLACGGTVEGPGGDGDGDDDGRPLNPGDGDGDEPGDGGYGAGGYPAVGGSYATGGDIAIGGDYGWGGYPVGGGFPGVGGGYAGGPGYTPEPLVGCQRYGDYSEAQYCEVYEECDNGWSNIWCDNYDGRTHCYCESSGGYAEIEPSSFNGGETCHQLSAVCQTFPALDPSVPEVCTPTYSESGQGYCSLSEECRSPLEVDGIKISVLGRHEVWCEGTSCQCNSQVGNARIELASGAATASTCSSALELCGSDAIAPTGMGSCTPRYQSAYQDYCEVELECAHSANMAGQAVKVFNSTYANCEKSGTNSYTCSCNYGADPFAVTSNSSWNVCSDLAERCSF